jgi:hypothetical protein
MCDSCRPFSITFSRERTTKFLPGQECKLKCAEFRKLYLDASDESLALDPKKKKAQVSYNSENQAESAHFDYVFTEDTELTGHMKLRL